MMDGSAVVGLGLVAVFDRMEVVSCRVVSCLDGISDFMLHPSLRFVRLLLFPISALTPFDYADDSVVVYIAASQLN